LGSRGFAEFAAEVMAPWFFEVDTETDEYDGPRCAGTSV